MFIIVCNWLQALRVFCALGSPALAQLSMKFLFFLGCVAYQASFAELVATAEVATPPPSRLLGRLAGAHLPAPPGEWERARWKAPQMTLPSLSNSHETNGDEEGGPPMPFTPGSSGANPAVKYNPQSVAFWVDARERKHRRKAKEKTREDFKHVAQELKAAITDTAAKSHYRTPA